MKTPFRVGDMVRVYCGQLQLTGASGTVDSLCGHNDLMNVQLDKPNQLADTPLIHARQCRRLLKKKRREWWVCPKDARVVEDPDGTYEKSLIDQGFVHVREVKKK